MGLTPDEQFQAGLTLQWHQGDSVRRNPRQSVPRLPTHVEARFHPCTRTPKTTTIILRALQERSLFDASVGQDNLFKGDRYKWSLRLTAVNITNKYALYNFLSTFSGTHYVTPRAMTAEVGFHF